MFSSVCVDVLLGDACVSSVNESVNEVCVLSSAESWLNLNVIFFFFNERLDFEMSLFVFKIVDQFSIEKHKLEFYNNKRSKTNNIIFVSSSCKQKLCHYDKQLIIMTIGIMVVRLKV